MQKKSMVSRMRKQAGFTLVELSMVLVIGGLLIAATIKGQQMIEVSKAQKLVADIKHLEGMAHQFRTTKNRFPGDCDLSGTIDLPTLALATGPTLATSRAADFNNTTAPPTIPVSGAASTLNHACAGMTGTAVTTAGALVNTWINDLKIAGLVPESITNRAFAQQVTGDFVYLANVVDKSDYADNGKAFNAIVIPSVPQWMARAVSATINGNDGQSNRGRVRAILSGPAGTESAYFKVWGASAAADDADVNVDRNSLVTIVYFFDKIPASAV